MLGEFVGKHLAREFYGRNIQVVGVGRGKDVESSIRGCTASYFACDLSDYESVRKVPWEEADAIISLAGLSRVGESFANPELYKRINVDVATNVCDYLVSSGLAPRFIAVSTGAVYSPNSPMPLTESSPLVMEGSPYAQSKILMEAGVAKYREKGLDCVIVRPFNHCGPGQEAGFLIPDLYSKIVASTKNSSPLIVGDLSTRRDYTDVRDVARAYADLALYPTSKLKHDFYNVCSGVSRSGQEILDEMLECMSIGSDIQINLDKKLFRPNDPAELFGNSSRLLEDVEWSPSIALSTTIKDFVIQAQDRA